MTIPDWAQYFSITKTFGSHTEDFLQAQVAHGIEYINKLILNHAHEEDFVPRPPLDRDSLACDDEFIAAGLDVSIEPSWGWTLADIEQDPEAEEEVGHIIRPPMIEATDEGPEKVWRWAYQEEMSSLGEEGGFARSSPQITLRACGYVFWNKARLLNWGLMKDPFRGVPIEEAWDQRNRDWEMTGEMIEAKVKEFIALGRLEWFW